jgi:hypothetical protein
MKYCFEFSATEVGHLLAKQLDGKLHPGRYHARLETRTEGTEMTSIALVLEESPLGGFTVRYEGDPPHAL